MEYSSQVKYQDIKNGNSIAANMVHGDNNNWHHVWLSLFHWPGYGRFKYSERIAPVHMALKVTSSFSNRDKH